MIQKVLFLPAVLFLLSALGGCSSTYYGTMEKFGVYKRDIMVDRVSEARDAQEEAKEQFQSALEQFTSVVELEDSALEKQYKVLNKEYELSRDRAEAVRERIESVESVSEALFAEWEDELDHYSSKALRRDSENKLRQTRKQYEQLIDAMWKAEGKIQPVLAVFHDQVLYLKHNLNAQAIAALQGELLTLEKDVAGLIAEMEKAIREADSFIVKVQNG